MTEVLDRQVVSVEDASRVRTGPLAVEANNAIFAMGLCYVAIPCLIFLVSFVRPWVGWPLAVGIALLTCKLLAGKRWIWRASIYVPAALLAVGLALLVGIPTGHANFDWVKHWALINELAHRHWPVSLNLRGVPVYLRFYLAGYLVPALLSKAAPALPIAVPVTMWFVVGYLLVFRANVVPHERRSAWVQAIAMVVPVIVSGADIYVRHIVNGAAGRMPGWIGFHYGNWAVVEFSSGFTSLTFVPHQSIAVFLVTAMLLLDRGEESLARLILGYGLLALWSPYGMIGLLPLMCLRGLEARAQFKRRAAMSATVLGVMFAVLTAAYLSTDLPASAGVCLSCVLHRGHEIAFLVTFLLVELCAFGLLLGSTLLRDRYCVAAVGTLVAIPFFHGQTLDFVARAAMGPLFVLAVRATERLLDFRATRTRVVPVTLAALICVPTIVSEIDFHYDKGAEYRTVEGRKLAEAASMSIFSASANVTAEQFLDICSWGYERQYFARRRPGILRR